MRRRSIQSPLFASGRPESTWNATRSERGIGSAQPARHQKPLAKTRSPIARHRAQAGSDGSSPSIVWHCPCHVGAASYPLTAEAAREAFIEAALSLGCQEQSALDAIRKQPLTGDRFALGDIAVAMRQTRLRATTPGAELLRDCLEAEWRTRQAREGRSIGFVRA